MSSTNGQQILGTHEQPARAYSWGTDPETIYKQSTDPAAKIPGMPPNMGELLLPQVTTFQGILSSVSRVYRPSDEALKHSFNNARFMLNDLVVTECLDQRRRSVCLLNWHLEPEDAGDARQKRLCADLTDIIERIPNFLKYREALSYAIWYGRYACQHRYRWQQIKNQMRVTIDRWLPVNGDKLVFRYDDGTNDYDPDQIGIRVGAGYQTARGVQRRWTEAQFNQVQPTDYGLAYFLNQWERPLLAIHRYLIEDGEYEDPMNAGRVQGLGIRSRIYWTWYQKQETLAWLTEYLERSALGMEVWYYPWGNNEGLQAVKKSAEERIGQGRNIVFVPRPMGDNQDAYGMERIEPGMAGAEVIERIVKEYFGHLLKRYILGQTMTTEAVPGSLGSGQGDVHLDTYMQIVRYDATNLEETLTADLVKPLQTFNFPWSQNVHIRFKIDTEAPDVEKKLAAWKDAYDMGMELKEEGLCDLIGAPKAEPGDVVLQNPEAAQGRRVKEDPAQGTGNRAQGTDFKGRSQVSLMGQDFIELMRILQKQGDEQQLRQDLGVESTGHREQGTERYRKDAAGHEHAPAGSPKGGEFVSQIAGGGDSHAAPSKRKALRGKMEGAKLAGEGKEKKVVLADGRDAPEWIKPSMIMPAWTDVRVAVEASSEVLVTAYDAKGRKQTVYRPGYSQNNQAAKFAKIHEMMHKRQSISAEIQARREDQRTKEEADCLWLIEEQATRPGSERDTGAAVEAVGATTLKAENITQDADTGLARLEFVGKKGVSHSHLVQNRELSQMLLARKRTSGQRGGMIFDTNDAKLRSFASTLDGGGYTPKDFRTLKATTLAIQQISAEPDCCRDKKEYKAAVKRVATIVSGVLGNEPAEAVKSYISPVVWSAWQCPDCQAKE